jgi:hypothetical protein
MTFKTPPVFSKVDLYQGFGILDELWGRNLVPDDLERHYFLYWFVIYGGNISETAKALQIHRNTMQGHFSKLDFSNKAVRLRHSWQTLTAQRRRSSFELNFSKFYRGFGGGARLSRKENKFLTNLWKTRFPFQTLTPHYLLWALNANKSKDWVLKKLNFSGRHRNRLLTSLRDTETRDGFWLGPLVPVRDEIEPRRGWVLSTTGKK